MLAIYEAAAGVRIAIDAYVDACEHISRLECPPSVEAMAKRGIETGRTREKSWGCVQDDPYCMNGEFLRAAQKGWKPRHLK